MQVSTTNQKLQVLGTALQSLTKAQAEILPVSHNCCSQEILSHNLTCQDAFDSAYLFQRMPSFLVSNKENWGDRQYLSVIDAAITAAAAAAAKKQVVIQILYTLNAVECSGATEKHEEETMSSPHHCGRFTHFFYASLDAVQKLNYEAA
jgi:hypothetical protein